MAIDPKKIEEWALAGKQGRKIMWMGYDGETVGEEPAFAYLARVAVPALLSEREEMQREILSLRAKVEAQAAAGAPVQFVPVDADPVWRAEALAVLRSVEWTAWMDSCPFCGGLKAVPDDSPEEYGDQVGHGERCRLAALLRGA